MFRRLCCLALALVVAAVCVPMAHAQALSVSDVIVRSAPLVKAEGTRDGMVRIYLSSMGSPSKLDITVKGQYSVDGNVSLNLSDGQKVSVTMDTTTGQMTMTVNGATYSMGREMALRRRQASGESSLSIAQARKPANFYPGDLQLSARASGSTYKLYPIVHVYIEYYLKGVVPYEMSSSWPVEALKAQAVAARTYTLNRLNGRGSSTYDLVDTSSDQVYYGQTGTSNNATQAVDATKGIVIMNNGKLSGTYYTASNGGQTESVKNVWGNSDYGYLSVKDDPFDLLNPNSNIRKLVVRKDFDDPAQSAALSSLLNAKAKTVFGSAAVIESIDSIVPHTPKFASPSRLYTRMDFGVTARVNGSLRTGVLSFSIFDEMESALSMSINSGKNELWSAQEEGDTYVLRARRFGHGIGLSQRGAQQMANMGYTYDQILGFYYDGCTRVQYTFTHTILPSVGSGQLVTTEAPATISPAGNSSARVQLVGATDQLALRYSPSNSGRVLYNVPNGSSVQVLSSSNGWTLIRYGLINGYVPSDALLMTGSNTADPTAQPTNVTQWAVVTGSTSLNLRSGPSYDDAVIGSLPANAVLAVLSTHGSWVRIQYGQSTGYCASSYLTFHTAYPQQIPASGTSAMVTQSSAPLRSTASLDATVILHVSQGTQVTVISRDGTWCRVRVSGVEGYMLQSMLNFDAQGTTVTEPPLGSNERYAIVASSSTLNLRAAMSTDSEVLAEIPGGTRIVVTNYGSSWCAVRWGDLTGYVMTSYLSFDVPTETPVQTTSIPSGGQAVTIESSNLYLSDSSDSELLLFVPEGETVTVIEHGAQWTLITYSGLTGYIATGALKLATGDPTPTASDDPTPTPTPTASPTASESPVVTPEATYQPLNHAGRIVLETDLREEANTSSAIMAVLAPGTDVQVVGQCGEWKHIIVNGMTGWVLAVQVMPVATASPDPDETETPTPEQTDAPDNADVTEVVLASAAPQQESVLGWIRTGSEAIMYASASTSAQRLQTIAADEEVTVLYTLDGWRRIRYGGTTGYVESGTVTLTRPTQIGERRFVNTATDSLAMRESPSTKGKLILWMPRAAKVTLIESHGDWSIVSYAGRQGYCASRYLSETRPVEIIHEPDAILDVTLEAVTGWSASLHTGNGSTVSLRRWCASDAPEGAEIPDGASVTLKMKGNIWCKISYGGEEGYCLTSLLKLTPPAQ